MAVYPAKWYPFEAVLRDRYCGKRAFAHHLAALALLRFGFLQNYQAVDWARAERLVFVCKGNICRSAYAHARVAARGFPAASFGIAARSGAPADEKAIFHAGERGLSLAVHETMSFRDFVQRSGDMIVCMEPSHAAAVASGLSEIGLQVTLLGLWSRPLRPLLADPFGADDCYWRTCLDIIDSAVDRILALICHQRAWSR